MKRVEPEMVEGAEAFDRFRKAMKTIVSVKKSDVIDPPKPPRKRVVDRKRKAR